MRRRRPILLPVLAGALCMATLGCSVLAAPVLPPGQTATLLGSLLCAPGAALPALQSYLEEQMAIPAAQTYDENDLQSGFWTQLPTEGELAAGTQPAPTSEAPQPSIAPTPEPAPAPDAPMPEGMVPLLSAHYQQGTGENYIASGAATIKNCTTLSAGEIAAEVMAELPFAIELNSSAPQVLIMHTHATETYETENRPWTDPNFTARTTDTALNMVAVGAEISAQLNAAGIHTLQDATLHDYPNYTGSYALSNKTVRQYLAQYPSIKIVLDVHRDAIQKQDGTRIKPIADIEGKQAAQIMLICGADKNGNLPNFKQNLRFASHFQNKMESMYPGLTRPVLFDYRYYNQDLTTGSLLLEMGGHANTLEEAKYSGQLAGKALAALLRGE